MQYLKLRLGKSVYAGLAVFSGLLSIAFFQAPTIAYTPQPPAPADPWAPDSPTPEDLQAISDFLETTYFTAGRTFSYTAPIIDGITPTPASYTGVLGASTNNINFVYNMNTTGSESGGANDSASTPGSLAETGANIWGLLVTGFLILGLSIAVLTQKRPRTT